MMHCELVMFRSLEERPVKRPAMAAVGLAQQTFPQDLMEEILSRLPVKALMRFRCISKAWNSLMSDPTFVELHFQRSSKNTHILLEFVEDSTTTRCFVPCSTRHLLENPSSATIDYRRHRFHKGYHHVGVCNGLVCLRHSFVADEFEEYWIWFRFWNPATRVMSADSPPLRFHSSDYKRYHAVKCGFGYDDRTNTCKVVAVLSDIKSQKSEVRVHCLGDTCWRSILTCPGFPMLRQQVKGPFVSGTVNWIALRTLGFDYQWETVTTNHLVIFSYDLKNETYRYLFMPGGLCEVPPCNEPSLGVLNDCLCLSYDDRRAYCVVWLMREFGVEKSWTQLLKVSYEHLGRDLPSLAPLCLSENEDVILLAGCGKFVFYNQRDHRIDHMRDFRGKFRFFSYEYDQSLLLPYQN